MIIFSDFINFFFPPLCISCSETISRNNKNIYQICEKCRIKIIDSGESPENKTKCNKCSCNIISEDRICMRCRTAEYIFEKNISIWSYQNLEIKKIIHNYKFSGKINASLFLADSIFEIYKLHFLNSPVIPAPCSRKRIKKYGWDHMKTISALLEKKYQIKVFHLFTKRKTRDQKELNYEERQKSLENKIILDKKAAEKCLKLRREIILIDDVFTTGATSNFCAEILLKFGFQSVNIITIAID